jgi:hypothetical protein
MVKPSTDNSRVARIRHACLTLDQLHEETYQLYLSTEAKLQRLKTKTRERAALNPVPHKR